MAKVQPDWRIVKVEQSGYVDKKYLEDRGVTKCGVYYLVDFNLHVHICSFTPNLEAWAMQGYADFVDDEAAERDEGEMEMEMINSEESDVSYFGTEMEDYPNISAANYLPDRDEDESDEEYQKRIPDAVREYLAGNPVGF